MSFPPDQSERIAGVLVPVFAIRTERDLGIGDVDGVRQMVDWAAENGFGFLQLLPINEMGGDNSPYNAISSVAIEPLTIDARPEALEDLTKEQFEGALAEADMNRLRGPHVRYAEVRALKVEILWRAFAKFYEEHYLPETKRNEDFLQFCGDERKWLSDYCLFRLLMDMEGGSEDWEKWSDDYNNLESARKFVDSLLEVAPEKTERQLAYYAYVQWIAFAQWRELAAYAEEKSVKLMGDVPFGVSRCSADVFANPSIFDMDWFGGAPPERHFKDDEFTIRWGQNWGIPNYRWDVMEKNGFVWWRRRISKLCSIFGLFRIDHVLGFYRIYSFPWRPTRNEEFLHLSEDEAREKTGGRLPGFKPRPDDSEVDCKRNRQTGEHYLKVVQEAAGDADIVAEDLGMVPDYVRPSLLSLGMAIMKVPIWEEEDHGGELKSGDDYPELSLATYATHDHEPIRTQWDKQRKIVAEGQPPEEVDGARHFLHRLSRFADFEEGQKDVPPAFNDSVREALLDALFRTKSRYAAVMITDLLGLDERFNVPGVLSDENWTHRLRMSVDELRNNPHWSHMCDRVKNLLKESGRLPEKGS